ncbi:Mucin-associated surface protein (MASP), subgroup S082 [Trypanosoma cruzi]|nr:Mucin-associated surface protein (MASP), subgroup S082 [Trypanosoma cruzi]
MAMMMTGRVLLVCALCVLWCGAGGCFANEERAGLGSGGGPPPESQELGTPRQETQDLKVGSPNVNGKVPPTSSTHIEKAEDEGIDDEDGEEKDKKDENEKNKVQPQTHEGKNNEGVPPPPPPPPQPPAPPSGGPAPSSSAGEGGPTAEKESSQKVTKAKNENTPSEFKTDSEAPEQPSGDATQGQHSHDTDKEDPTKNAATGSPAEPTTSSTSTSGSGDHVQNKADEDDAQSSEGQHNSLETGNTNVVPTLSETAPQTATANTTDTANTQNSDGSTAVSHTTSPLLLLLLVACAAAAAVVAA